MSRKGCGMCGGLLGFPSGHYSNGSPMRREGPTVEDVLNDLSIRAAIRKAIRAGELPIVYTNRDLGVSHWQQVEDIRHTLVAEVGKEIAEGVLIHAINTDEFDKNMLYRWLADPFSDTDCLNCPYNSDDCLFV